MKSVYIMTDIEGVAGVVSFDNQTRPDGRYYEQAKKLLTGEINAAVDGLLDVGVEHILVVDGHGWGGICYEDLHEKTEFLHGKPTVEQTYAPLADYDALIIIGQHAMAGIAAGNLNHTGNSKTVDYRKLNGRVIGELCQCALMAGLYDVPMIFLSGDTAACNEAEDLIDGIVTASVKRGISRNAAISVSTTEARLRIYQGVKKAVQSHQKTPIAPLKWPGPYEMESRFFFTDIADSAASRPDYERVDDRTVRIQSENLQDILY